MFSGIVSLSSIGLLYNSLRTLYNWAKDAMILIQDASFPIFVWCYKLLLYGFNFFEVVARGYETFLTMYYRIKGFLVILTCMGLLLIYSMNYLRTQLDLDAISLYEHITVYIFAQCFKLLMIGMLLWFISLLSLFIYNTNEMLNAWRIAMNNDTRHFQIFPHHLIGYGWVNNHLCPRLFWEEIISAIQS